MSFILGFGAAKIPAMRLATPPGDILQAGGISPTLKTPKCPQAEPQRRNSTQGHKVDYARVWRGRSVGYSLVCHPLSTNLPHMPDAHS